MKEEQEKVEREEIKSSKVKMKFHLWTPYYLYINKYPS